MKTQVRRTSDLYELTPEIENQLLDSKHYNPDLAPTKVSERTWRTKDIADFWLGLSVSIPRWPWPPLWWPWACLPCWRSSTSSWAT